MGNTSISVGGNGRNARLRLRNQPLVDTIAFGDPGGLSSSVDIELKRRLAVWIATDEP
ncbi:MAG: hypothetical protein ACI8TP_001680 [Acidimicrobiales bacterium]|jgi:hypothetical protein